MSTMTFGSAAPSDLAINLDSVFATSLELYNKELVDNIGASNAFLHKLIKSNQYQAAKGGAYIKAPLMYALAPATSYAGYDELSSLPVDGITDALYDWCQGASPISYNEKEVFQNQDGIIDLVEARIKQAEGGLQEFFSQAWWWGAGAGALSTPYTDGLNGSTFIDPIAKMIAKDPTASASVGNINQNTYSWWRNKTSDFSGVTTLSGFMLKLDNLYNSCALGTGGPPDLIVMDQTTYELFNAAYFQKYRKTTEELPDYPFEAVKFKKATVVMEDKVPDVVNNVTNTTTAGTVYMMNTKYFKVRYASHRNFVMLKDENGKAFKKPLAGDSRLGHVAWMGGVTMSNRRKQGVGWGIPRTLTFS